MSKRFPIVKQAFLDTSMTMESPKSSQHRNQAAPTISTASKAPMSSAASAPKIRGRWRKIRACGTSWGSMLSEASAGDTDDGFEYFLICDFDIDTVTCLCIYNYIYI